MENYEQMKVSQKILYFSLRNFFFYNKMENYEQMKVSTEKFVSI